MVMEAILKLHVPKFGLPNYLNIVILLICRFMEKSPFCLDLILDYLNNNNK